MQFLHNLRRSWVGNSACVKSGTLSTKVKCAIQYNCQSTDIVVTIPCRWSITRYRLWWCIYMHHHFNTILDKILEANVRWNIWCQVPNIQKTPQLGFVVPLGWFSFHRIKCICIYEVKNQKIQMLQTMLYDVSNCKMIKQVFKLKIIPWGFALIHSFG